MKVLQLIGACQDCPKRSYYSGGRHECTAANQVLPYNEGHRIPSWCPLADYPAREMASLEETVRELQGQLDGLQKRVQLIEFPLS